MTGEFAVIFDMDGVVVDNTKYHILTWKNFSKTLGFPVSAKTVKEKFLGRLGREIMRSLLPKKISRKQLEKLDAQREACYRKIYAKAIKPVKGLPGFLKHLQSQKVKIAMATSAPPANVKFVLSKTGLKKYFKIIIDANGVKRGKPYPDIFLKAAKRLKVSPKNCVVFEDAMHGIEAARRAGMKVVGVATSHHPKEIGHTDLVIKDFSKINIQKLKELYGV